MCLSTSTIFSMVVGSISGEVMRFSTASTTPSEVWMPIAVEPSLIASIAYSTCYLNTDIMHALTVTHHTHSNLEK